MDACNGEGSFPATVHDGWEFREDVPGKPGWIAMPGREATITFTIETPYNATLRIGFLHTYTNVGTATCWLDRSNARGNASIVTKETLDGRIAAKVSVPSDHIFKYPVPPGTTQVTCRTDGNKFKIVTLR